MILLRDEVNVDVERLSANTEVEIREIEGIINGFPESAMRRYCLESGEHIRIYYGKLRQQLLEALFNANRCSRAQFAARFRVRRVVNSRRCKTVIRAQFATDDHNEADKYMRRMYLARPANRMPTVSAWHAASADARIPDRKVPTWRSKRRTNFNWRPVGN